MEIKWASETIILGFSYTTVQGAEPKKIVHASEKVLS